MQIVREFGDDPHALTPSGRAAMKAIEKLPLPYTGNKKKLIYAIHETIMKHGLKFNSVLDAFSGSATISFLFKMMGKKVLSNDILTCSYLNSVAFVENPGIKLTDEEKEFLLLHENSNKTTFVEDNYLGISFRENPDKGRFNKFTLKECQYLDNFRANIDELCNRHLEGLSLAANAAVVLRLPFGNMDQSIDIMSHRKKQSKEYGKGTNNHDRRIGIYYDDEYNLKFNKWFKKYVSDFMKVVPKLDPKNEIKIKRASCMANLQQHILRDCFVGGRMHNGQVLSEVESRLDHQKNQLKRHLSNGNSSEMNFTTQRDKGRRPGEGLKWWSFADLQLPGKCLAVNMDILTLLESGFCDNIDCAYFDPPYGGQSSDYATMYRFLEEYIYSDKLENLPHLSGSNKFVKRKNYEPHFVQMLDRAKNIPLWMFSYNDSSWKNTDYIKQVIQKHNRSVIVEELSSNYRYLYRKRQGRGQGRTSKEYLIIARSKSS